MRTTILSAHADVTEPMNRSTQGPLSRTPEGVVLCDTRKGKHHKFLCVFASLRLCVKTLQLSTPTFSTASPRGPRGAVLHQIIWLFIASAAFGLLTTVIQPNHAWSQPVESAWDMDRYQELVAESDRVYDEANESSVSDDEHRALLLRSADLKEEAVGMLRQALLSGLLDDYGDLPREDLLLLHQNLVVVYSELGSCGTAETRMVRALQDSPLLLEGAVDELDTVRARIEACRAEQERTGIESQQEVAALRVGGAFREAAELFEAGRFEEAAGEYFRLVVQSPNSEFAPAAVYNAALSYERIEQYDQATQLYEHVLAQYPDCAFIDDALFRIAVNSTRAGNVNRAIEAYLALAEQDANDERAADALFTAAELLQETGELARAAAAYEDFALDFPQHENAPLTLYRAGLIYRLQGRSDSMIAVWELMRSQYGRQTSSQGVGVDAMVIGSLRMTAELYADLGDTETAGRTYREVVDTYEARQPTDTESIDSAAQARFFLADQQLEAWLGVSVPRDVEDARQIVHDQIDGIYVLEAAFDEVIVIGSAHWTIGALYMIGLAHETYVDQLRALPVPATLADNELLAQTYRDEQESFAAELSETAVANWQFAVDVSRTTGVVNEWTMAAISALNEHSDSEWPLTAAEQAFLAENPPADQVRRDEGDTTSVRVEEISIHETAVDDEHTDPLPFVFLSAGAALLVGGIAYDLSLAGDRDEFDLIQSECAAGPCDYERGQQLQSDLYDAQPIVGALLGVGLAGVVTGAVLLLTSGDDEPQSVALEPMLFPDCVGVRIGWER